MNTLAACRAEWTIQPVATTIQCAGQRNARPKEKAGTGQPYRPGFPGRRQIRQTRVLSYSKTSATAALHWADTESALDSRQLRIRPSPIWTWAQWASMSSWHCPAT